MLCGYIQSLQRLSQRTIWSLGSAGALLAALAMVGQPFAGISSAAETTTSQDIARAAIIPEQRTDYCAAPPTIINPSKIKVTIANSDDSNALKNGPTVNTIYVDKVKSSDTVVTTLKDIQTALANLSPAQGALLTETTSNGQHIWTLKMHVQVRNNVTLRISGGATGAAMGAQVDELRLRSDPSPGYPRLQNPNDATSDKIYDFNSFAALRSRNGRLFFDNTKVTSWDTVTTPNQVDTNYSDGRPFILAREQASMSVCSSEIAYLGFSGGQAYGLSWRDVDPDTNSDGVTPYTGPKRTRVTGDMVNSLSHNNYYGVYTFQAKDMIFRGNKFYDNIQYGFDPHDYTTDVLVENNESYHNGSHGFIISRGCQNFVFRKNVSHDNIVKAGSKNPSAHGFMLDPGSEASGNLAPSINNLYEDNQAYNNDGYGFRIYESDNNTFRNNTFSGNRLGVSIEVGSTGNVFDNNMIINNLGQKITENGVTSLKGGYGIHVYGGSDSNTFTNNTITGNATIGISLETGKNLVQGNTITGNGTPDPAYSAKQFEGVSISVDSDPASDPDDNARNSVSPTDDIRPDENLPADDYLEYADSAVVERQDVTRSAATAPASNTIVSNTISNNATNGITLKGATGTQIKSNIIESNRQDGISLSADSSTTQIEANTIRANAIYGVEIAGTAGTQRNTLTRNAITGNGSDGISVRDGANNGVAKPNTQATLGGNTVSGTALPNAKIEVFTDSDSEGAFYEGTTTANASGAWSFTFASAPQAAFVTVTQTDSNGNTSAFSAAKQIANAPTSTPTTPTPETPMPTTPMPTTPTPTTPTPETPTPTTPTPESGGGVQRSTKVYLPTVRK